MRCAANACDAGLARCARDPGVAVARPQGDACSHAPVRVTGGHRFVHVEGGVEAGGMPWFHSCGLTTAREVYCWGTTWQPAATWTGETEAVIGATPVLVEGGLEFTAIGAGNKNCGLTASGAAYCWRATEPPHGQLGNGSTVFPEPVADPVAVVGGRTWRDVSAGMDFTCGVTTGGEAYCWGENSSGVVGDQPTNVYPDVRTTPVRVTAAPPFKLVRAGASSACGLTLNGIVHCWGEYRRLGIGPPS
jgi:alpha-tubulin suppressor-like RCC1 family protein